MNSKSSNLRLSLRPDLAAAVERLVRTAPRTGGHEDWRAYSHAKSTLSRLAGWDAPPDRYDQRQYDAAVEAYIREVGL